MDSNISEVPVENTPPVQITEVDVTIQAETQPTQETQPQPQETQPQPQPQDTQPQPQETQPQPQETQPQPQETQPVSSTSVVENIKPSEPITTPETPKENESKKDDATKQVAVNADIELIEKVKKDGLDILINKYLDDGIVDNDELVDLVQATMEIVEGKKEIKGEDKKKIVLSILKQFLEKRVENYDKLEVLIVKAIDLAVNVSKNGLEKIKINSDTITESKAAFNLIYSTTLSKIEEKYPLADDIMNNLFDIALYIVQLLEGQTSLTLNEKKVLLKKILYKVINSLESKLSEDQREFLKTQIDPTISLVQISFRASTGELQLNAQETISIFCCICAWFRKCFSKK